LAKKVLIIENDFDIRAIVATILEDAGFAAHSIPEPDNVAEILGYLPDIILIDDLINKKPGHRLCLQIKADVRLTDIPVIVLSTDNDIELIAKACQANDYIRKPFDLQEMVDKVVRVVNGHSCESL